MTKNKCSEEKSDEFKCAEIVLPSFSLLCLPWIFTLNVNFTTNGNLPQKLVTFCG